MEREFMEKVTDKKAMDELKKGFDKAKEMLQDHDRMERFLQNLEQKIKMIPFAGKKLSKVPIMAALINSYVHKEYTDIPMGTIVAVVSALIYFASPIDIVPDSIPFAGYLDDAAVVKACWKMVESDINKYLKWRDENNRTIEF